VYRKRLGTILLHGVLLLVVLALLGPIFYIFVISLKTFRDIVTAAFPFEPTLYNYEQLFISSRSSFTRLSINSLVVGSITTIVVLFVASLGAYSLSRFRWRPLWSGLMLGWLLVVHMMPPVIFIGPFYLMSRSIGIYDTVIAVAMAHTVLNLPLAVWMLQSFFADIPVEIEEAAFIDGCSRVETYRRIILPLARPGIAATAVLVFVFSWKDFLFALTLTSTPRSMTVPVGIAAFAQEWNIRYGEMAAAAFFALLPALLLVVAAQRNIVKGMTLGALKG
jgi:multiple sugar transport system permease protein